jgi:hypothetical protein
MIDTKELRIGNWVADKAGQILIVDEISHVELNLKYQDKQGDNEFWWRETVNIEPIPLTINQLIGFGFEEKVGFVLDTVTIMRGAESTPQKPYFMFGYYDMDHFANTVRLYYVHQLQNLYFTLTGKELQFDPSKIAKS